MLTQERLRELLAYNARTGEWTWLKRSTPGRGFNRIPGTKAGSIDKQSGYRIISVDREQYRAGRLAFFYVHGRWPLQIDHKDGNPTNDAWPNLREVTAAQNSMNRRAARKVKFKGVDFHKGIWRARLRVDGKLIDLGSFDSAPEAASAYDQAALWRYGAYARLNFGVRP
jgi:HNH endonuclease